MSNFVHTAIQDIRGGRENWRVVLFVSIPAFTIAVVVASLQNFY